MANKLSERLEALMALVEKATPGVWEADGDDASFHKITICGNDRYACSVGIWQTPRAMGLHDEPQRVANASAIVAAVNFLRDHGPALAELARRVEWQPIETAPKDGSEFLSVANYADEPRQVQIVDWDFVQQCQPGLYTHWMPLPEPPEVG